MKDYGISTVRREKSVMEFYGYGSAGQRSDIDFLNAWLHPGPFDAFVSLDNGR